MNQLANIPQIPYVRRGDKITAIRFNEIAKAINTIARQRPQEIWSMDDTVGGATIEPFQLLTTKPSHVLDPDPAITLAAGEFVLWIQDGLVNNTIPSNMNNYEIIDASKLVLLKLNINSTAEFGVDLTSAEIVLDSYDTPALSDSAYPAPAAGFQGLPPIVYLKIGAVIVTGTGSSATAEYVQYGTGNIQVTSEVSSVTTDGMGTYFRRQLKVSRY